MNENTVATMLFADRKGGGELLEGEMLDIDRRKRAPRRGSIPNDLGGLFCLPTRIGRAYLGSAHLLCQSNEPWRSPINLRSDLLPKPFHHEDRERPPMPVEPIGVVESLSDRRNRALLEIKYVLPVGLHVDDSPTTFSGLCQRID
jgi:hypothetical protein